MADLPLGPAARRRRGGRLALGLAGTLAAALAVGAVLAVPFAFPAAAPAVATVTPVAAPAVAACAGPFLAIGSTDSTQLAAVGAAQTASVGASGITAADLAAGTGVTGAGAAASFTAPAASGAATSPLLGAAQSQAITTAEARGFTAAACTAPTAEAWLVGGSNDIGETSILRLSNPGGTPASVDLQIWGEQGAVTATGAIGILVNPHAQTVVPLAGIAPGVIAPVIHLLASGGTVAATVQQSYIAGIAPAGADLFSASVAPVTHVVVPGVVFTTMKAVAANSASDEVTASADVLRVFAPGAGTTSIQIGIRGESGRKWATATQVTIAQGIVQDVPLTGMPDGTYDITVDSGAPITVAARTLAIGKTATDFAWWPAAEPLGAGAAVAVAPGPGASLHLVNPTDSAITVSLTASGAAAAARQVAAHSGVALPVVGAGYTLAGAAGLLASVSFTGDGALGGYGVAPAAGAAPAVTVYTR